VIEDDSRELDEEGVARLECRDVTVRRHDSATQFCVLGEPHPQGREFVDVITIYDAYLSTYDLFGLTCRCYPLGPALPSTA
jgi:hypothetical protein